MSQDEYARLFNTRGHQYDQAMTRYPQARAREFCSAIEIADIKVGSHVADIPCGGGYLARYLAGDITLYSIDSSDAFADCFRNAGGNHLLQCPIEQVPLPAGSLDHILSIAGLHHIADRRPFFTECARLLKPGGVLTVGDVRADSAVAHFLDGVVDRYTPTGHQGMYFNHHIASDLEACGFQITLQETRRIPWRAKDADALADFCRLLFGLEGIDAATLRPLLEAGPGIKQTAEGAELNWELMFFRAVRC